METDHVVEEQPKFWEPWSPKAGDRVRVVLRGECPFIIHPAMAGASYGLAGSKYHADVDGKTGTIEEIDSHRTPRLTAAGHRYRTRLDEPYWDGGHSWSVHTLAAVELVKIEP